MNLSDSEISVLSSPPEEPIMLRLVLLNKISSSVKLARINAIFFPSGDQLGHISANRPCSWVICFDSVRSKAILQILEFGHSGTPPVSAGVQADEISVFPSGDILFPLW